MTLAWIYLALAVLFEIAFALSMKASKGFTVLWPTLLTVVGVIGGIGLLTLALRTLPVSVGYPVWVGAGAIGTVLLGHLMFGEPLGFVKLASVALIAIGVAGLKASAAELTVGLPS
ncbi:MAG: DMT family transporter [Hyphomicrobiaceae bacterium]